jgi:hypothetical protein
VKSNNDLNRKIKTVKIDTCNQNTLFGEVISENKRSEFAA